MQQICKVPKSPLHHIIAPMVYRIMGYPSPNLHHNLVTVDPPYSIVRMLDADFGFDFQMYLEYEETLMDRYLCRTGIH